MTSLYLVRHGETDWNRQGLSQGSVDIPLNELGLAQAREAAQKLRGRGIASIVASPLSRARVTAEIVGEVLGLDGDLRRVMIAPFDGIIRLLVTGEGRDRRVKVFLSEQTSSRR